MSELSFRVYGIPAPQGSKSYMGHRGGKAILRESSKAVGPWREAVKQAALLAQLAQTGDFMLFKGACFLDVTFYLAKPQRPKHKVFPAGRPDLSKLLRSTEDALTDAGVWKDDAQNVLTLMSKKYVTELFPMPGADIYVTELGSW